MNYQPNYDLNKLLARMSDPTLDVGDYELRVSQDLARKSGRRPSGQFVPYTALTRALTVGTGGGSSGGKLVETELQAAQLIELLRNRSAVIDAGARVLTGLVGNVAIPRQTAGAGAYWVAESGAPTEAAQAFDQVALTPKTVGAFTDISRKMLLQSSIDVSGFVASDLMATLALAIDSAAINGTGASNQPTGILNAAGVTNTDLSGAAVTWSHIVALETAVATANADAAASCVYIMGAAAAAKLRTTLVCPTGPDPILTGHNGAAKVNGYRAMISNQVPAGTIIFGNWADLVIAQWGAGADINLDRATHSASGGLRVVALQDVDIALRHPASFAVLKNIG